MADRCFVAVEPSPALVERLRSLERPARPGLRWTPEGQWHVTLKFFRDVDRRYLVAALSAWAASGPGFPPAEAVAGPRPRALSGRVWMVPVDGLGELAGAVDAATGQVGPGQVGPGQVAESSEDDDVAGRAGARRPFRGHLTLARARHPSALRHLDQPDIALSWPVAEIVAVRSELTGQGARHEVLDRWPLPA